MMKLTCGGYGSGATIPLKFVHGMVPGGKNVSPAFAWSEPPIRTKSFALTIVDPHPVAKNWMHWCIVDIPFRERGLGEGASRSHALPPGARELLSTYGEPGYGGPAPPVGSGVHPYVATIYALSVPTLELEKDAGLLKFLRAIEGKVIEESSVTGNFEQK
jgi:Raf kinase inhibitor-like YbhB/YbcL family protein